MVRGLVLVIGAVLFLSSCSTEPRVNPLENLQPKKPKVVVKDVENPVEKPGPNENKPPNKPDDPRPIEKPPVEKPKEEVLVDPKPIFVPPDVPMISVQILKPVKVEFPPDPVPREELNPARYDPTKLFEERWKDFILKMKRALEDHRY